MRVVYIAGPYRSSNADGKSNAWGVQQNVMRAMARALEVWRRGHAAVCPHSNTMFFQDADGCVDSVWLDGDIEILRRCDAVLTVEGWQRSKGATAEVRRSGGNRSSIRSKISSATCRILTTFRASIGCF